MNTLRDVRLWHWQRVLRHRANAHTFRKQAVAWEKDNPGKVARHARSKARQQDGIANRHLGAVQALNDVVDGTAEQDQAMWEAARARNGR